MVAFQEKNRLVAGRHMYCGLYTVFSMFLLIIAKNFFSIPNIEKRTTLPLWRYLIWWRPLSYRLAKKPRVTSIQKAHFWWSLSSRGQKFLQSSLLHGMMPVKVLAHGHQKAAPRCSSAKNGSRWQTKSGIHYTMDESSGKSVWYTGKMSGRLDLPQKGDCANKNRPSSR